MGKDFSEERTLDLRLTCKQILIRLIGEWDWKGGKLSAKEAERLVCEKALNFESVLIH